jgi:hypothetical protein
LRRTRIPAVLVECGFLTNPTEAQYAQSSAYRQKLAEEIARGIRGRSIGATGSLSMRVAGAVPLQPFLDQTRVRDPDISRSRHSKKSSKHKSSKSKNSKSSSSSSKAKKKSKKTED